MGRTISKTVSALSVLALTLAAVSSAAAGPRAKLKGAGEGLKYTANLKYASGTDMELTTINGRDYAFAGSRASVPEGGGLRVIDITDPARPKEVAYLPCSVNQADIQISHDQKTVIMAADVAGSVDSCLMLGKAGFMTVDISNPLKPRAIGYAEIPRGSHNTTAHPKKPYVYNSDSDRNPRGEIQIWSITNPAKPKLVNTVPDLPNSPHDISFNKDGTLMVTAAVNHFSIFDTTDPENPVLKFVGQCPGCTITHDAKFTPDGKYLFIGDEANGGGAYPCPGGALYAYQMNYTPAGPIPALIDVYVPEEFVRAGGPGLPQSCTSHVFEISDDSKRLAISWYTAGTRYLDISDPTNIQEIGWFIPEGGDSWSSKFHPRLQTKWIYSNDINHGFDVFQITGD